MQSAIKDILRAIYRVLNGATILAALPFRERDRDLRVFYGGARPGDFGGTLVKVRLLQARFPEHRVGFSILYMLSNAIYLPAFAVARVRAAGVPLVLNQNGVFYPGWYPTGWERENARMAGPHATADYVFYQSEFCRRCAEQFLGPRTGRSEILYNAVDTGHFAPRKSAANKSPFNFLANRQDRAGNRLSVVIVHCRIGRRAPWRIGGELDRCRSRRSCFQGQRASAS